MAFLVQLEGLPVEPLTPRDANRSRDLARKSYGTRRVLLWRHARHGRVSESGTRAIATRRTLVGLAGRPCRSAKTGD